MTFVIEEMRAADWEQVRLIYLEGIETGNATFETEVPSRESWDASHMPFARLVARETGGADIKGWGALSPVSTRRAYAGVAEISVYVSALHRGEGVGRALLATLVSASEQNGIWTLQAGIFPENAASLALHRRCGFREIGRRERIARLRGQWRDTVLMERRSERLGVE